MFSLVGYVFLIDHTHKPFGLQQLQLSEFLSTGCSGCRFRLDAPVIPFALMMAGVFSQNVSKDYPILSDPRGHPVERDNQNIQSEGIRMTGASSRKGQLEHPCAVEWSIQSKGIRTNWSIQSKGTTRTLSPKGQLESMQSKCW